MKLPHADIAIVPRNKIVGYLLSTTHNHGRHKAAFFLRFGFDSRSWTTFADSLRQLALTCDVLAEEESAFGTRFVVDGRIESPDGRDPSIRTIWFIETGESIPRFVTAYPREGNDND
jgi:hypothetical protein